MQHTYSRYHQEQLRKERLAKVEKYAIGIAVGLFLAFELLMATSTI